MFNQMFQRPSPEQFARGAAEALERLLPRAIQQNQVVIVEQLQEQIGVIRNAIINQQPGQALLKLGLAANSVHDRICVELGDNPQYFTPRRRLIQP